MAGYSVVVRCLATAYIASLHSPISAFNFPPFRPFTNNRAPNKVFL